jgi:type VI secretion system secreted protein Hcp
MALQMFLKVDGIDGDSKKKGMEGAIDLLSCSFGLSRPSTMHTGSGGSGGDVFAGDVVMTKNLDTASNGIRKSLVKGEQNLKATVTVRKPTGEMVETLKYEMEGCMFTSANVAAGPADDVVIEDISIAYTKVTFTYVPEESDGSAGADMACTLNIEEGSAD